MPRMQLPWTRATPSGIEETIRPVSFAGVCPRGLAPEGAHHSRRRRSFLQHGSSSGGSGSRRRYRRTARGAARALLVSVLGPASPRTEQHRDPPITAPMLSCHVRTGACGIQGPSRPANCESRTSGTRRGASLVARASRSADASSRATAGCGRSRWRDCGRVCSWPPPPLLFPKPVKVDRPSLTLPRCRAHSTIPNVARQAKVAISKLSYDTGALPVLPVVTAGEAPRAVHGVAIQIAACVTPVKCAEVLRCANPEAWERLGACQQCRADVNARVAVLPASNALLPRHDTHGTACSRHRLDGSLWRCCSAASSE